MARLAEEASSPASTMLPPSNGRIGRRLNSPITGPAHHRARAASDAPDAGMQRMHSHRPQSDDADGDLDRRPGEADAGALPPLQRAGGHERGVAGEEVERDLGACAGGPGGEGVAELVQQREHGDEAGQPQTRAGCR